MKITYGQKVAIIILISAILLFNPNIFVFAQNLKYDDLHYIIYDESGEYLTEKTGVNIKDYFITDEYDKYEVVSLDSSLGIGVAKFVKKVSKPNVYIDSSPSKISGSEKKICLYMTHNDESYVTGDGVDSVYGKGGIHNVALQFAKELQEYGITTYVDETLHIPHDTKAYTRSATTCQSLINKYSPNAIFDIHRDGTARSHYITKVNGKEESMVRIVVGKANSNMDINEEFALYIMAVANEVSPGLIKDIYYASGHYNQGKYAKSLLFEMGSHMVEKSLVMESTKKLANVVNTALFNTVVDEERGDTFIDSGIVDNLPTVDEVLEEKNDKVVNSNNLSTVFRLLVTFAIFAVGVYFGIKLLNKK